ncbi:MAG: TSUP family transporter [Rhodospirillales bacterium]|nr:TSUP family transporter [Alphaproteobacteria bacterium]MCB9986769.1 TSUP family transporter [Rhodospirillales bacterium]USO08460.1 MAG: TSUP family transporter [Rhodospirillales bacterium]
MWEIESWLLVPAGFVLGIAAVVFGGTMFFTIPLMQALFPQAGFGVIVGNAKTGSFFRSIGSTVSTHSQIAYRQNLKISTLALVGTVIGASAIAQLSQIWLFPAVVVSIMLAVWAPRLAPFISEKTFHAAAFLIGIYAGLFGAGIGVLLLALLRLKFPDDADIAFVKIQARFVEFLLVISAVVTHWLHGNLVAAIWVPWSAGALVGGYTGGLMLNRLGGLSPRVQKSVLYASFALAFCVAGYQFVSDFAPLLKTPS